MHRTHDTRHEHDKKHGQHEGSQRPQRGGATNRPGNLYLRVTLSQWRRSHRELESTAGTTGTTGNAGGTAALAAAAVHAVLARLRSCADQAALVDRYDADPSDDFALVGSLLPLDPDGPAGDLYGLSRVREAAFWLRWLELTRAAQGGRDAAEEPRRA